MYVSLDGHDGLCVPDSVSHHRALLLHSEALLPDEKQVRVDFPMVSYARTKYVDDDIIAHLETSAVLGPVSWREGGRNRF
jgi:hypothetical protein